MTLRPYNVLFLCTGNSARSILAEALLNQLGNGHFKAFSAGSQPKGHVHPYALDLLRSLGHPVAELRSKSWDEFGTPEAPALDFVFTVCDNAKGEACPLWPGRPVTAHWGLPDPANVEGCEAAQRGAFVEVYRMLNHWIRAFVSLPIESLDWLSLHKQIAQISQDFNEPAKP